MLSGKSCLNQYVSTGNECFRELCLKRAPVAIGGVIPLQLKTGSCEVVSYHFLIRAAQNFSRKQIAGIKH